MYIYITHMYIYLFRNDRLKYVSQQELKIYMY